MDKQVDVSWWLGPCADANQPVFEPQGCVFYLFSIINQVV